MNKLEQLYSLIEDPDSYWVVNDLCIENNWALASEAPCPMSIISIDYVIFIGLNHASLYRRRVGSNTIPIETIRSGWSSCRGATMSAPSSAISMYIWTSSEWEVRSGMDSDYV